MPTRLPARSELHRAPATIFSECSTQPRAGDMAQPHGPRLDTRIHEPLTESPPAIPGVGGAHLHAKFGDDAMACLFIAVFVLLAVFA